MTALHHRTPLIPSEPLGAALGAEVWLKMEALQPSGSFKLRGMARACQEAVAGGARRLVSSSGGNAGYAVAWAGRRLGVPVTVVVPSRTAERMRDLIVSEHAEVLVHGDVWDEAHQRALSLADEVGGAVIHPFDGPAVWAGHASLIEEVAEQGPAPGAVVVSVGGGGLLCGVVEGLHRVGWSEVPVLAVETHGAASFAAAVAAGRAVDIGSITTLALTLGARQVCDRAVQWAAEHPITPWQCDDRAAVEACAAFLDDHRVLVEPSCGAALAAVYGRAEPLRSAGSVLVVVCGGASVTRAQLEGWGAQVAR